MIATAKVFRHGGSQAIRLPKAFRFEGTEVEIEKRGDEVLLRSKPGWKFETASELAEYLAKKYPDAGDFPDVPRPTKQEERDLTW